MRSLLIACCLSTLMTTAALAEPRLSIYETLDAFHLAAARADLEGYLGLLTPDVVFLGTDSSERWQGEAFRTFVRSSFSGGEGWTYVATERDVTRSADGRLAWFDELLDNAHLGRCRGSGVLELKPEGWRIAQYNLSVPIPNSMVLSVATRIREQEAGTHADQPRADSVTVPAAEQADPAPAGKCAKRFKTNTRAGC